MAGRDQDGNPKKGYLERFNELLDKVPGLDQYRELEKLRDQDKVLRTHTAERIAELKGLLDQAKKALVALGKFAVLDQLDELTRKLDTAADIHRFDAYGFTDGLVSVEVDKELLASLYEYDQGILEQIDKTQEVLESLGRDADEDKIKAAIPVAGQAVADLVSKVQSRSRVAKKIG